MDDYKSNSFIKMPMMKASSNGKKSSNESEKTNANKNHHGYKCYPSAGGGKLKGGEKE